MLFMQVPLRDQEVLDEMARWFAGIAVGFPGRLVMGPVRSEGVRERCGSYAFDDRIGANYMMLVNHLNACISSQRVSIDDQILVYI